jgi:DHA1 family bicyclomycin/chloramphenicol resistance-like MFS transporter
LSDARAGPSADTIFLLAAIAALGSLGTHLLVPVLPLIADDLGASAGQAQRLIAIYLIGLACGQLAVGPLFDRKSRKAVLVAGLTIFSLASAASAIAGAYAFLAAARFLQALGAAVGIVGARVLISELYPPAEAVRRQSTLMAFVLISPAVGPAIGGAIGEVSGWRTIMILLAAAAIASIGWTARSLHSGVTTGTAGGNTEPLAVDLLRLVRNARFRSAAIAIAGGSGTLYMFLTAAPFLLVHDYGLDASSVGLLLMLVAGASIAGTFIAPSADRRGKGLVIGTSLILTAPLALMAVPHSLAGLIAAMFLLGAGAGLSGPAGIARVLRSEPQLAGTSAALSGAFQMAFSATCAAGLSYLTILNGTSVGLSLLVPAIVGCIAATMNSRT